MQRPNTVYGVTKVAGELLTALPLQVDGEALLVAIEECVVSRSKPFQAPGVIALRRRLDANDLRAQVVERVDEVEHLRLHRAGGGHDQHGKTIFDHGHGRGF